MNNQDKIEYITQWIIDYVSNMPRPAKSLVVGVSGGIDSALTSTLSSLTGINTIAISMPISKSSSALDLSKIHGKWLEEKYKNTNFLTIDLTPTYKQFNSTLVHNNQLSDLGFANSKSRLRMVTLYQVAASQEGIVVGTGNKVEDFGVGFYTKYGDGGVDISPIADCNKTQVWELGKELGILNEIIEAAPTDGLWDDGRTDEGQLGLKYEELEEAMDNPKSSNRAKYETIRKQNLHKMEPIPVCKIPN